MNREQQYMEYTTTGGTLTIQQWEAAGGYDPSLEDYGALEHQIDNDVFKALIVGLFGTACVLLCGVGVGYLIYWLF